VFFITLAVTTDKYAVYIACVFGSMFYSVYFIPFWACRFLPSKLSCYHSKLTEILLGRSSALAGTAGTAFTLACQSCVGKVGE
jgi:hypothetical protein